MKGLNTMTTKTKEFTTEQKEAMKLDYINNFLTVEKFAEHYEITTAEANQIINEPRYIINGNFHFEEDTDPRFMDFINNAYISRARVVIVYNDGWEDFTGYHGGDGLHHSIYIGRSTGEIKIPLAISRRDSSGGPALTTCKKAIKTYYRK